MHSLYRLSLNITGSKLNWNQQMKVFWLLCLLDSSVFQMSAAGHLALWIWPLMKFYCVGHSVTTGCILASTLHQGTHHPVYNQNKTNSWRIKSETWCIACTIFGSLCAVQRVSELGRMFWIALPQILFYTQVFHQGQPLPTSTPSITIRNK